MSQDYYKVLGVDSKASKADIKKAFRAKAKEHHPDKGGEEAEFKKINEAYEVLSDDQKKSQYDQFGSAGPGFAGGGGGGGAGGFDFGGMGGDFGGFGDVFSSFFGGAQGGGGQRRRSSKTRGSDLEVEVELSFEESLKGATKIFSSKNYEPCEKCDANGGEGKKTCGTCHGSGTVSQKFQTPFGTVAQQGVCQSCQGEGSGFEKTCSSCHGEGRVEKKTKIEIEIPAGINHGESLRLSGKGEAGRRGGSRGDLYVHLRVHPSREFERQGLDLHSVLKISVFEALLGCKQDIKTFWGKVKMTIPELTHDREVLRLAGKGVRRSGQLGDHLVHVEYVMPKKITPEMQELLKKAHKLN